MLSKINETTKEILQYVVVCFVHLLANIQLLVFSKVSSYVKTLPERSKTKLPDIWQTSWHARLFPGATTFELPHFLYVGDIESPYHRFNIPTYLCIPFLARLDLAFKCFWRIIHAPTSRKLTDSGMHVILPNNSFHAAVILSMLAIFTTASTIENSSNLAAVILCWFARFTTASASPNKSIVAANSQSGCPEVRPQGPLQLWPKSGFSFPSFI